MLQAQSSTSFKSMSSDPPEKEPEVATRMSARILFRKKLKGLSNKKFQQQRVSNVTMELPTELIQVGNPDHKFMFLRLLGLTPKPEIEAAFIAEQKRLSIELTSYPNSSPNLSEDEDLDDLDLEVVFCPLDIPEIYEEITKRRLPGYRPPSSCGGDSSFNNSSCGSSMSSMSSESDYYYGSGVKSKSKKFSSRINLEHHYYNPVKLSSATAAGRNMFKSTSSSAQSRRRRPPPDIIPIHPRGQKSIGGSSIHNHKNHNNKIIKGIVARSPQFVVKKSLPRSGGARVINGKLNGNGNKNNVRSRIILNKTNLLQFDDGLDGLQVISHNNNYTTTTTTRESDEDPDSLQAIKMRLGMLETELDFV